MAGGLLIFDKTPADGKLRPKPKTTKYKGHRVTHGEKSVTQKHQQHGELLVGNSPKRITDIGKSRGKRADAFMRTGK
jgi:hypothetical protein